jgi:hypothetical protein
MNDLIEKYFREDLSETEEARLSELLASSDEAANLFSRKAEEAYRRYGLPEPEPPAPGGGGHWSAWILSLAVFGFLGTAVWVVYRCAQPTYCERTDMTAPAVEAPRAPVSTSALTSPASTEKTYVSQPPPALQSAGHAPSKGKGLQILVPMSTDGHASVRVLDSTGREVRRLFDGSLKAGKWNMNWDGLVSDGKPVAPGIYRVEVDMNGTVRNKEVRIR